MMRIQKKLISCSLVLILAGCGAPLTTLDTVIEQETLSQNPPPDMRKYRCSIGAHRGDSNRYTENTLNAISSAVNNNRFTFIEFDVQYTLDRKIVAYHDKTLLRLYGSFRKINSLTFDTLKEKTGNNIALYYDVMDVIGRKHINIEIKSSGDKTADKKLVDQIVQDIKQRGIAEHAMISSISADVLNYIKTVYPGQKTGQVFWIDPSTYVPFDFLTENLYNEIQDTGADYLMLHVSNLHNLKDLFKLKPKTVTLIFWNFDDKMYLVHKDPTDVVWGKSVPLNYVKHYSHSFQEFVKSKAAGVFNQ